MVMGLTTIPDSKRFTARTASACSSTERLRLRTPSPPSCAITIAMSASVTVSMAEERIGILRPISLVTRVRVSAWLGRTSDSPRSEEHTSELQSLMRSSYAVFCLKKKNHQYNHTHTNLTNIIHNNNTRKLMTQTYTTL